MKMRFKREEGQDKDGVGKAGAIGAKVKGAKRAKSRKSQALLAVWVAAVGVAIAAGASFIFTQTTEAVNGTRRKPGNMTQIDRTMYYGKSSWKCDGETYGASKNKWVPSEHDGQLTPYYYYQNNLLDNECLHWWQPVDQEYALGYLNNGLMAADSLDQYESKCSGEIFNPSKVRNTGLAYYYKEPESNRITCRVYANNASSGALTKDLRNFADFTDVASYMGEYYDVREYFWTAYRSNWLEPEYNGKYEKRCASKVYLGSIGTGQNSQCVAGTVAEFHFYPSGTLAVFDSYQYLADVGGDYLDVNGDGNLAYYPGSFIDNRGQTISWAEYQRRLREAEDSVTRIGYEDEANKGVFKGLIRFDDIDSMYKSPSADPRRSCQGIYTNNCFQESYAILDGVDYVYTVDNTRQREGQPFGITSGSSTAPKVKVMSDWYNQYCNFERYGDLDWRSDMNWSKSSRDTIVGHGCGQWGGTAENNRTDDQSSIWLAFTSTSKNPLRILYHGRGHISRASSETKTIVYVVDDDLINLRPEIRDEIARFQAKYAEVYGRPLSEDPYLKTTEVDANKVLRLFRTSVYSDYDVYWINSLLKDIIGDDAAGIEWYEDPSLNYPVSDSAQPTFIDDNKIYYTSFATVVPVEFSNTCYSDNTSTVESRSE